MYGWDGRGTYKPSDGEISLLDLRPLRPLRRRRQRKRILQLGQPLRRNRRRRRREWRGKRRAIPRGHEVAVEIPKQRQQIQKPRYDLRIRIVVNGRRGGQLDRRIQTQRPMPL